MATEMTFEQIDEHIKKADLKQFQPGGRMHFTAESLTTEPGGVLQKLCGIYKVIKPILSVLVNLPLIPAAWKAAIRTFMELMGTICP